MDLMDMSNEIQETLGRSYNVPDDIDEDDLMGGRLLEILHWCPSTNKLLCFSYFLLCFIDALCRARCSGIRHGIWESGGSILSTVWTWCGGRAQLAASSFWAYRSPNRKNQCSGKLLNSPLRVMQSCHVLGHAWIEGKYLKGNKVKWMKWKQIETHLKKLR